MLPTPFTGDGTLATGPYERLVAKAADAGCRGVVCLGVMGEAPRLSDAERAAVLEAVVAQAGETGVLRTACRCRARTDVPWALQTEGVGQCDNDGGRVRRGVRAVSMRARPHN